MTRHNSDTFDHAVLSHRKCSVLAGVGFDKILVKEHFWMDAKPTDVAVLRNCCC